MFFAIANTVSRIVNGIPALPMIWNLNSNLWENETRTWN